jgi:PAS domain S-box-containing protein
MTGYDREAILGRPFRSLLVTDTDDDSVAELRAAVDAGESVTTTIRTERREGEAFRSRVSLTPLHDEGGGVARWVGFHEAATGR